MENHGIDVSRRRELVRETMLAMQALWTHDVASFEGEFVRFEPSWQWPKPTQCPRPRTLIGGAPGPKLFAQLVARTLPTLHAHFIELEVRLGGKGTQAR